LGEIKTYPSKRHSLSEYSTYTWLPPRIFTMTEIKDNDPVYSPLIREAVNRQLVKKGYTEMAQGGQLQVIAAGMSTVSAQLEAYLVQWGFADADYYNTIGVTSAIPIQRVNREGVLAVALYDPKLKISLWSGYISEALGKPGNPGPKIDDAAAKLLKKLPEKK
jgi:hypothetical protein